MMYTRDDRCSLTSCVRTVAPMEPITTPQLLARFAEHVGWHPRDAGVVDVIGETGQQVGGGDRFHTCNGTDAEGQ